MQKRKKRKKLLVTAMKILFQDCTFLISKVPSLLLCQLICSNTMVFFNIYILDASILCQYFYNCVDNEGLCICTLIQIKATKMKNAWFYNCNLEFVLSPGQTIVLRDMLCAFGHRVAICWVLLAQTWKWSNLSQQHPTRRNTSQQGGQTHTTCCAQQCCDLLRCPFVV